MATILAALIAASFLALFMIGLLLYLTAIGACDEIRSADSIYAGKVLRGTAGARLFGGPVKLLELFRYEAPRKVSATVSLMKSLVIAYFISLATFLACVVALGIISNR
jgi:hypothetical protein